MLRASFALLLTIALSGTWPSHAAAQNSPATFYGGGLVPGAQVTASIAGRACGSATVNPSGQWAISVPITAPCSPTAGATVTFSVNNQIAVASPPATWQSGGIPGNSALGYTLQIPSPSGSTPAVFYGRGLTPGRSVQASIGGLSCGTSVVNAVGEWSIAIAANASCGPMDGAAVGFTIDGLPATAAPAAVWRIGGTPANVATGYVLTRAAETGVLISGSIPPVGFGLIVFGGGSLEQLVTATGCPRSSMALYASAGGEFRVYVPGAVVAAVNDSFLGLFPGGRVPSNTILIGKCQ